MTKKQQPSRNGIRRTLGASIAAIVGFAMLIPASAMAEGNAQPQSDEQVQSQQTNVTRPAQTEASAQDETPEARSGCAVGTSTIAECFPDQNLAQYVASRLSEQTTDVLSQTTINNTTSLNLHSDSGGQIRDLTGLEKFTNLTDLDVSGNQISDLSSLSSLARLSGLTKLDLGHNLISNLGPLDNLKDLSNLTDLDLSENSISGLGNLKELTHLNKLDLSKNSLTDITDLSDLHSLTNLNLARNQISDLSPLSGLSGLTSLDGSENYSISDISPLRDLTGLTYLSLYSNSISDISDLENLTNLNDLNLNNNRISDISALSNLTRLNRLCINTNRIVNVSPLKNLTTLTELRLGTNKILDISDLAGLTNLTTLTLGNNNARVSGAAERQSIKDITPLKNMTQLEHLELGQLPQLSDISTLSRFTHLKYLEIFSDNISDITPLTGLINLVDLGMWHNPLSDITPLAGLTNLKGLKIYGCQITDITPLKNLTNLEESNDHHVVLGLQDVMENPATSWPVTLKTAQDQDGNFIAPTTISPAGGTYDPATGIVTWTRDTMKGKPNSVQLKFAKNITFGPATKSFDGTITRGSIAMHTVTFDTQGGTPIDQVYVDDNQPLGTVTSPTYQDHTFQGWQTKLGETYSDYDTATPVTADITLYAKWGIKGAEPGNGQQPTKPANQAKSEKPGLAETGSSVAIPAILAILTLATALGAEIAFARYRHRA